MAKGSVNKVILIGNLGRDPEVRFTPNGLAVANVTIATSEVWKDKTTGENQERTEWHRVVLYNRLAEIAGEYLRKGNKIFIEGRLQTRKWLDKTTNQDRYTTEVIADSLEMLGGKSGSTASSEAPPMNLGEKTTSDPVMSADNFAEDDIPF